MVNKTRIGVTGNAKRWSPSWYCTALALQLAGASAHRISTRHTPKHDNFDALIIGGGDDISPEHYQGDMQQPVALDTERDQLEIEWIEKALDQRLPLLGICRGAQLINVVLGGNLHQDIRPIRQLTYNRPGLLATKQVRLAAESTLAAICGKTRLRVNSLHHQAVKNPGAELKIIGWDLDNISQAIESDKYPIIGVQWHPEYLFYLPAQFALFRWLVKQQQA